VPVLLLLTGYPGRLVWQSQELETLFKWMPGLLPKHFFSFVLDHTDHLQKRLEEAFDSRPWVFAFADVRVYFIRIYNISACCHTSCLSCELPSVL